MMDEKDKGIESVLIDENSIQKRVKELGEEITKDYKNIKEPLYVIGLLKGSFVFTADIVREIDLPVEIDFMIISSYGNDMVGSEVHILKDIGFPVYKRDILVIEDIVDTGITLKKTIDILITREANSIEICTLLNKPSRRKTKVDVKYNGFEIEDKFVVGYGIDYAQKYRNLPYIGVVK